MTDPVVNPQRPTPPPTGPNWKNGNFIGPPVVTRLPEAVAADEAEAAAEAAAAEQARIAAEVAAAQQQQGGSGS